ncbi:integrase family protein [Billgrantia sulfidoxydans]|uniref:Integrase family protein n=1 Tax=Billgrantia sulfidoxydans TaxID=2733484 RepID=A0ABX7W4X3_9GAMM|nr:integrase family protein [Halomonas sulfidoxydans]QTP55431.1 integrase family protein [Halomonas sulfidoxydans]
MTSKIKLTKTTVERLAPVEGKQLVFWDTDIVGFGVRVSPGGSRAFFYQGRLKGKLKKITIGKLGRITAEQARKDAKRIQSMMELGQDPSPKDATNKIEPTFGDLMSAYVELLEQQGKLSASNVKNQIARDIEKAFPKLWAAPVSKIQLEDCMQIVGKLKDEGKPRQADKIRSYIRTAFSEAINARGDVNMPASMRRLKITYNPARDMRKVKGSSNAKDRALSLAEFRAYWRRVKALPEPHRSLAMLHVLTGGQRQQQLARVTLADIDRDGPSMRILDYKGRRTEPRIHVIPLLPEALEAIDRITGGGQYVFSCDGGKTPIHNAFLNDIVKRIRAEMEKAEELENGPFTAGSIRATVETRLIAKPYRVSSDVLAHLLSHGMGTVQRKHYQHHAFADEKLESLEMLYRMVEGKSEPGAKVIEMRARA